MESGDEMAAQFVQVPMLSQRTIPMSKPWRDYRDAFDQFARKVRYLQNLASQEKIDHGEIELALLAVEQARLEYNARRDVLARELLRRSSGEVPTKIDPGGSDPARVRPLPNCCGN